MSEKNDGLNAGDMSAAGDHTHAPSTAANSSGEPGNTARGPEQSLEALRRQAKQLLKGARNGDTLLLSRLRALLPRFASVDDTTMQAEIKLADVQHAIARRAGSASWAELTRIVGELDPVQMYAGQFLKALRDEQTRRAHQLFAAHPELAAYSIHTAAAVADLDVLRHFIAEAPSGAMSPTQPDGTEPIVYAVLTDIKDMLGVPLDVRLECVRLLLDAGANPNASVPFGDGDARIPVLYFPAAVNQEPIVRLLLERGATPNDGESVFHAAQNDHRACLETLLEFGAELSLPHASYGNTPLYFLAGFRETNRATAAATRGMQWLLEHGADPNVPSHTRSKDRGAPTAHERPLHRLAASGRGADVAELFIAHGAEVDAQREDGRTAFTIAVRAGNSAMADCLARHGADTSRLAAVDRLLGACAVADERAARAIVGEHPAILRSLTAEERQLLGLAMNDDNDRAVALMLSLGWPLDSEGEWGGTPLHWAAWNGRVALVRQLIETGAPINMRDSSYGSSPIAWAAHGSINAAHDRPDDYVAIVHMLLDAGATRAESYNKWNESPENLAAAPVKAALKSRGFAV